MSLVCVFGISGVGKTTRIGQFVWEHRDWRALSAGEVLAQLSGQNREALRTSDRAAIEGNQTSLAEEIRRRCLAEPHVNWLLDAHSVIDNGRELVPVPVVTISRIAPHRLVFLFDEAAEIHQRRAMDDQRERPLPGVRRMAEEQSLAWQTCVGYARELKLELYRVNIDDPSAFARAILATSQMIRSTV
jgi:adenylate kinase